MKANGAVLQIYFAGRPYPCDDKKKILPGQNSAHLGESFLIRSYVKERKPSPNLRKYNMCIYILKVRG